MGDLDTIIREAKRVIQKKDFDDIKTHGKKYFACGYKPYEVGRYYNVDFAIAVSLIGRLCNSDVDGSDYKKGIHYIANQVDVSKAEVKSLRKQFGYMMSGYVFRVPYNIPLIVDFMINVLEEKCADELIREFLNDFNGSLYRDVLIEKEMYAIRAKASGTTSEEVKGVRKKLEGMNKKII